LHQTGTYNEARAWSRREPEVLDWIDGMSPESVFFDVGANFGTEALKPNGPAHISAFDPESFGNHNLALNSRLNGISKVDNYACAIGSQDGFLALPENFNYHWIFPGKIAARSAS
jgi:hypothetical protein